MTPAVARNAFSAAWVDAFLRNRDSLRTAAEVAFVVRNCPKPAFTRILDVPCGLGRHANALVGKGYSVTGVDRDAGLIREAWRNAMLGSQFVVGDMAKLGEVEGEFDAVICIWQSFGYFDDAGNAAVLRSFAGKLRAGGRLVLDVLHRGFFERKQGRREIKAGELTIVEERKLFGNRELVTLSYGGGRPEDVFDWRLYTPEELIETAAAAGLTCILACARFEERMPCSDAEPAMQLLFEKNADAVTGASSPLPPR